MVVMLVFLLGFGLLFLGYMYVSAHQDHIHFETIRHPNVPKKCGEYKIFFIADIHRRNLREKTISQIQKDIDIVCIGGDLLEKGVSLQRVHRNIALLNQWQVPLYFVWGNHDEEVDIADLRKLLTNENVTVLEDDMIPLVKNGTTMWLAGFKYEMYPESEKAMIAWEETGDAMTLLLTHKPSSFFRLEDQVKRHIDLVLAGHTHGGQIRLFGYGPYKRGGLKKINQTYLLVTEGYGYSHLPFRLGTRAECHVVSLKHGSGNA